MITDIDTDDVTLIQRALRADVGDAENPIAGSVSDRQRTWQQARSKLTIADEAGCIEHQLDDLHQDVLGQARFLHQSKALSQHLDDVANEVVACDHTSYGCL